VPADTEIRFIHIDDPEKPGLVAEVEICINGGFFKDLAFRGIRILRGKTWGKFPVTVEFPVQLDSSIPGMAGRSRLDEFKTWILEEYRRTFQGFPCRTCGFHVHEDEAICPECGCSTS